MARSADATRSERDGSPPWPSALLHRFATLHCFAGALLYRWRAISLSSAAGKSVKNFNQRAERISHTAFGEDELWLRRIRLDLAAQSQSLNGNGSGVAPVVPHPAGFSHPIPPLPPLSAPPI